MIGDINPLAFSGVIKIRDFSGVQSVSWKEHARKADGYIIKGNRIGENKTMRLRYFSFVAMVWWGLSGILYADIIPTKDDAQLRDFILQVIKENPKLILDIINDYAKEQQKERAAQQKAQEARQFEDSFKNRINDSLESHTPLMGSGKAIITIIEYSDFQCPYCSQGASIMKEVLKRYPEKVRIAFKHNPLNFHQQALPAAKAAMAAGKQGKFWEYHDLLFQNSSNLNEENLKKFAQDLQLDMARFEADRQSEAISNQIQVDMVKAKTFGLTSTPTFLVNGVVVRGAKPADYFARVIDRLITEADSVKK
jgi:protein-disulfide isomerase